MTTSFTLAIEIFSIRKTLILLISDHFDKLAFSPKKRFTDDVIFSHADTVTGCPLDANNIKFRAYRRLVCCYPARMPRETWVGMSMVFSSSMKIFLSYVPGMHVVVFTRSSSVARALWPPHPSAVAYCNTLKGPSQAPTREPWIHGCVWCLLFSARPRFKVCAYDR